MKTRTTCEREHDFALVLSGFTPDTPGVEEALFEAGCDDATLSFRSGRPYMTFSRMAPTLREAILSAIRDVMNAKINAEVLRVDNCNLVTQSDIARRMGRHRQQVHQYITGQRGPGDFPPPVCQITDGAPLWAWCEVADWLWRNDLIKEDTLREAEDVAVINGFLDAQYLRKVNPELAKQVTDLLGS